MGVEWKAGQPVASRMLVHLLQYGESPGMLGCSSLFWCCVFCFALGGETDVAVAGRGQSTYCSAGSHQYASLDLCMGMAGHRGCGG